MKLRILILKVVTSAILGAATSVTQHGITWTFDTDYTVGQYANGDYYVVAPSGLTITGITPSPSETTQASSTVTISQGNPAVVTWPSHGRRGNHMVRFTTDGQLPAGLTANTIYYVKNATADTFQVASALSGSVLNTSSAGSGTHTAINIRVMNGAMTNPTSGHSQAQGFDSEMYGQYGPVFDYTKNAARPGGSDLSAGNPLVLAAETSLVSSRSKAASSLTSGVRPQLDVTAVLTVEASAPAAGSFRPPLFGSDKSGTWNKSGLDYTILQSVVPVAGTPSLSSVLAKFDNPWWTGFFHTSSNLQYTGPSDSPSGSSGLYGREVSQAVADAVLSLHLNYTNEEKEALFVSIVQMGIDCYGAMLAGANPWDNAGIQNGMKLPVLFAALALGDPNIEAWADAGIHFVFSEDKQTFIITQADVGRVLYHADGRTREEYIQADVGLPESGEQHTRTPSRDGRNWSSMTYRNIIGNSHAPMALAAQLTTGGRNLWNWEPFFLYAARYAGNPIGAIGSGDGMKTFHYNMWVEYSDYVPANSPPIAPSALTISAADAFTSLVFNFTDNATDETGFEIQSSPTGGGVGFSTVGYITSSSGTGAVQQRVYGLLSGKPRFYRIRAVNSFGNSAYTSEVSATTLNYGAPAPNRKPNVRQPGFTGAPLP